MGFVALKSGLRLLAHCDNAHGDDLKAFMELFLDAWFNRDQHDVTRHVARHLILAHHHGTTIDAKIMLVHAALEYLSCVTYVLGPLRRSESHHDRKRQIHCRGDVASSGAAL